jgi:hypothetical protein
MILLVLLLFGPTGSLVVVLGLCIDSVDFHNLADLLLFYRPLVLMLFPAFAV